MPDDVLLDSNVIARYKDAGSPQFQDINEALRILGSKPARLCYVPQVAYELAVFMTRPTDVNGFGLTPEQASRELDEIETTFTLRFPDASAEYRIFRTLQEELGVSGKHVHDIRLVASCRALSIPVILTADPGGFASASQAGHVQALTPADVIAAG